MNEEKRLLQYINEDAIYQSWKNDELKNPSDFDNFCITLCKDIEVILNENQEFRNAYNELRKYIEKNKLVLQNPQILDFFIKMQEIVGK